MPRGGGRGPGAGAEQVLSRLRQRGVQVLDASPDEVDARLIDRYLEVKRRELVA